MSERQEQDPGVEAPESHRLEQLGRERPKCFVTWYSELAFCFSVVMSQILAVSRMLLSYKNSLSSKNDADKFNYKEYYISGFNVLLPTLIGDLHLPEASSIWPSTALSLAVTSTLLIFGRLADMFGAYALYVAGFAWLTVTSLLLGFSQSWLMLIIFRALQGLALGAYLPSGVMLLGSIYRPGPRKNIVFSVYGACAALGFYAGIFFSGLCGQFLGWQWYFYIGAILSAITLISSIFSIPSDYAQTRKLQRRMDWWGAVFLVPGLILCSFALADSAQAPHQWRTPYIPVCLVLGVILLGVAVYIEGWIAEAPLLPSKLFAVKSMKPLLLSLIFLYGCLGVFLLYAAL